MNCTRFQAPEAYFKPSLIGSSDLGNFIVFSLSSLYFTHFFFHSTSSNNSDNNSVFGRRITKKYVKEYSFIWRREHDSWPPHQNRNSFFFFFFLSFLCFFLSFFLSFFLAHWILQNNKQTLKVLYTEQQELGELVNVIAQKDRLNDSWLGGFTLSGLTNYPQMIFKFPFLFYFFCKFFN